MPKISLLCKTNCGLQTAGRHEKTDFSMFFARETPNFQNFKKQKIAFRANILRMLHAKNQPPRSKTVAYRPRTDMKKRILACFLRAKRPIFKISKNKKKLCRANIPRMLHAKNQPPRSKTGREQTDRQRK